MGKFNLEITERDPKNRTPTKISYANLKTQFGECLIGVEDNSIYFIHFFDSSTTPNYNEQINKSLANIRKKWPWLQLERNLEAIEPFRRIFEDTPMKEPIKLTLVGTEFQRSVWRELLNVQCGTTTSYEGLATALGRKSAVRAVANAIAGNNLAYVVPCHRVISKSGGIHKYAWGVAVKKRMLAVEGVRM